MDTDSIAIVASREGGLIPCPGGPSTDDAGRECVHALSWEQTDAIAERFASLNPYNRRLIPDSILELEPCAYDKDTGERLELTGYSISSKRYCYYTTGEDGSIHVRKFSEHGLGQYLDPTDPDPEKIATKRAWIEDVWKWIIRTDALGEEAAEFPWLDVPALRSHPISTPEHLRAFDALNAGLPYAEQVKPHNFMAIATQVTGVLRRVRDERLVLVRPFSRNRRDWYRGQWINIHEPRGGQHYRIGWSDEWGAHTFKERGTDPDARNGEVVIPVKTFRDVLDNYVTLPELKSNGPDGKPCEHRTRGLLGRRHVVRASVHHLGKEPNLLAEVFAGLRAEGDEDVQVEYAASSPLPSRWTLALEVVAGVTDSALAEATRLKPHTIAAARSGGESRAATRSAIERFAAERLLDLGLKPPRRPESVMAMYLAEGKPANCPQCGSRLPSARATYCSNACRQKVHRARGRVADPPRSRFSDRD